MIISGWKSRISCACFRSVRRTSDHRRAQTFRAVVRAKAAGKQAVAVGDVNFIFAEPPAARSGRQYWPSYQYRFAYIPPPSVCRWCRKNAHHLLHRHREGIEGIVVAQILFGGTGNFCRSFNSRKSSGCTPAASNLRRYIGTFSYACFSVHFRRWVCRACNSSRDAVSIGSNFVVVIIVGYSQVN